MADDFDFEDDYANEDNLFWFDHLPSNHHAVVYGSDRNFIKVTADSYTNLNTGFVYITTTSGLYVINMSTKLLYDAYTFTVVGRAGEGLDEEFITDSDIL